MESVSDIIDNALHNARLEFIKELSNHKIKCDALCHIGTIYVDDPEKRESYYITIEKNTCDEYGGEE